MFYAKQKPRIIKYRDYKNFNKNTFRMDLLKELSLSNLQEGDFDKFKFIVSNLLESHAPLKEKYIRRNQAPFMNKSVRKAIMVRTQLLNKFRKENSFINELAYKRQRNFCTTLIRKTKRNFYNNLNVNKITDNKSFWKTVKPSFTEKTLKDEKIVLVENDTTFSEENEIAEIFRSYFDGIVDGLNIKRCEISKDHSDPILNAIKTFEKHPSILKIKKLNSGCRFSFKNVSLEDVKKVTRGLDITKASQLLDIPTKIIKQNADIFYEFFFINFNHSINNSTFPQQLKWADVKPVFKKNSRTDKENYRPVSILPNVSKIYERCLYKQLYDYFEVIFSQNQCGFRKGFSVENCLLPMIEKWRESLDQGGAYGALLRDLSKAFDCLPHELIIAKLYAYGVDMPSLKLINSYLSKRRQRIKINDVYSSWSEILFGVPQGSILGPLLFNVFICDLFMFLPEDGIANYADDNTPYSTGNRIHNIISDLEQASDILSKWFIDNYLKANPDKYHLLLSETSETQLIVENVPTASSCCEKLLGIKIDYKLSFEPHVESLCKKASQKLNALARLTSSLKFKQRKLLLNAFITAQFSYAPAVWMFHSRKLNNRINHIHERALRLVYRDYTSSFDELLPKDNSFRIHHRNLQKLAIEIFKVKLGIAPQIMKNVFPLIDNPYNLRNETKFKSRNVHTVQYGIETASFVAPRIWSSIPRNCKECSSVNEFKAKIKFWYPENCPCKLCKNYIYQIGYT